MKNENEKAATETGVSRTVDAAEVDKAIRTGVYTAAGLGIVPIPLFNAATVTASNVLLARKLAGIYGVDFKEGVAKKIIASMIGAGTSTLATPLVISLVSQIPFLGTPLSVVTMPVLNGMTTYALARMFVTHFERGGNFVGTNVDALKEYFQEAFKNSREWLSTAFKDKEKAAQASA